MKSYLRSAVLLPLLTAPCLLADVVAYTYTPPNDPFSYFFTDWNHHGLLIYDGVNTSVATLVPGTLGFGRAFPVAGLPLQTGFSTLVANGWDTSVRGLVTSVDLQYSDFMFPNTLNGTVMQSGSVIWNETTNEFFVSFRNGMTTNQEAVAATGLTPAGDYCLWQGPAPCSAITGFGAGILHPGFVLQADVSNETFAIDANGSLAASPPPCTHLPPFRSLVPGP